MHVTEKLRQSFSWWEKNIQTAVNPIRQVSYQRFHSFWSSEDRKLHIDYFELLAVFLGLKCFAKNVRNCSLLLRIDNTTEISYVNRMGGGGGGGVNILVLTVSPKTFGNGVKSAISSFSPLILSLSRM